MSFDLELGGAGWRVAPRGAAESFPATVPGCVHLDLLRAGRIPDPFWGTHERDVRWIEETDWVYRREFEVPEALWQEEEIELVAQGLDTVAEVRLNGRRVGRTDNMFVGHRWPIRRHLQRELNRLEITFASAMGYVRTHRLSHRPREFNDPVGGCTRIRKQQCSFGWDWGPRLVTAGIWRPIRLEGWTGNRLVAVRVRQRHTRRSVTVSLEPEYARPGRGPPSECRIESADGRTFEAVRGRRLVIDRPSLWWPNGLGEPSLHRLAVATAHGTWAGRIGLRTLQLLRQRDRWGESFEFAVNGRRFFAKGANWIPAHALAAAATPSTCERLLRSATAVHMNFLRVWGGGVYETDGFYDRCDELGLLVWQDFMFACTRYPADRRFLDSVKIEAAQQVRRLRHHACLALWCGNNEIELMNPGEMRRSAPSRRNYDALFRRMLPAIVRRHDGSTPYWRSSPCGSQLRNDPKDGPRLAGDWHDWDVWHGRQPIAAYEANQARFVSEFGMQSFSSPAVAATYADRADWNIFAPALENHQKNPAGNAIILDYVGREYPFPGDYAALAYLSQINQARCLRFAVERWRRSGGRTRGALYWQLNDCWPGASWSTLEFGGRWKPAHYEARRFFAPVLVCARVVGEEKVGVDNWMSSSVAGAELHTAYDGRDPVRGTLGWELWNVAEARVLRRGRADIRLTPGESRRRLCLDFAQDFGRWGREALVLRYWLAVAGFARAEDTALFTVPRRLAGSWADVQAMVRPLGEGRWRIAFLSRAYHHRFFFDLEREGDFAASDNSFDLFPGVRRSVDVDARSLKGMTWRSALASGAFSSAR